MEFDHVFDMCFYFSSLSPSYMYQVRRLNDGRHSYPRPSPRECRQGRRLRDLATVPSQNRWGHLFHRYDKMIVAYRNVYYYTVTCGSKVMDLVCDVYARSLRFGSDVWFPWQLFLSNIPPQQSLLYDPFFLNISHCLHVYRSSGNFHL